MTSWNRSKTRRNKLQKRMDDPMPVFSGASSCFAQVESQKQKQIKLDAQLHLRDERQRELDHLEEEYHRKRSEINRRYNELLNTLEQNKQPALMLLEGNGAASRGESDTKQVHATEAAVPMRTPAAAAASHDHLALLRNGPLRSAAASHAHTDPNGSQRVSTSPDQSMNDGVIRQHKEATATETDQGHAEIVADEVVIDSEDEHEDSPQEDLGQLHARRSDSAQPDRLQSSPIADGRNDRDEQGSGQLGTMHGPEAEAASGSEPEMQDGMSAGAVAKQKERVKGRVGDTFYVHREPRSAPEASESSGWAACHLHASFMPACTACRDCNGTGHDWTFDY